MFHVMPEVSLAPLEELFRARVIRFLVKPGLCIRVMERRRACIDFSEDGVHPGAF
jgi:hypothetical protein